MITHNYFNKIIKKINLIFNNLINIYLNKLNLNSKKKIFYPFFTGKRVFFAVIVTLTLFLSYLSLPVFYDKSNLLKIIKNQLKDKFDIKFIISSDMKYNILPWPNYTFKNVKIINGSENFADIEKLKIDLSIQNFFEFKTIKIKDIYLENANFSIHKKNLNFFYELLDRDFSTTKINIINSNIFYKNLANEVLFLNKIKKMVYYYHPKKLKNILDVRNEIFNIPYQLELFENKSENKIFSKINLDILNYSIENEFDYNDDKKKGLINIIFQNNRESIKYAIDKNFLIFEYFDKKKDLNFNYEGKVNFKPFYAEIEGKLEKVDILNLLKSNSIMIQFFKTEILNNKNLNLSSLITSKKISQFQKLGNLILSFKIKEGLIDIDNTKFEWSNYAIFKISESLLYLNENNLVLNGKLNIEILNDNEIYKFFQTPRNYREEVNNIEFNFNYNFDQEIIKFSDILINDKINENVNKILSEYVYQDNKLQNKIYLKNFINKVIKAYVG